MLKIIVASALIAQVAGPLSGQTLAQRIGTVGSGTVRLSFAAREGVCSHGGKGISFSESTDEWQPECGPRVVRVALQMADHRVESIRTYVGGRWKSDRGVQDLGTVGSPEAARFFLDLAQAADTGASGDEDLLLPAILADSITVWPSLVTIARSSRASEDLRKRAVFWLGQAAGRRAGLALDSIAGDVRGDREVRKQAIFALSQRPADESVPALMRIARTSGDPELRRTALFWLGQSGDPRAVALFEEILQ